MIDEFQKQQLKKLREYKAHSYPEASIYTVLLDLCEGNGIEEVHRVLEEVVSDLSETK